METPHDREHAGERRRRAAPEADTDIATDMPQGADLASVTFLSKPSLLHLQRRAGNNAVLRLVLNEAQRRERAGGTGKDGDTSDADHAADEVIELDADGKNPKEQAREQQEHQQKQKQVPEHQGKQKMKEAPPRAKVPPPSPTATPKSGDGGTDTTDEVVTEISKTAEQPRPSAAPHLVAAAVVPPKPAPGAGSKPPAPAPKAHKPKGPAAAAKGTAGGPHATGAAHAGGGGGGGGGHNTLDAWKATVAAVTGAIADPKLDANQAAAGKLAEHAQTTEQQRHAEQPDYGQEAQSRLPPAPQEPPREKQLDTRPADAAIARVEAVGNAKLPDQTFPAMAPLPAYVPSPGTTRGGGLLGNVGKAAGPAKSGGSGVLVGPAPADAKADAVKAKVDGAAPTKAGAGPAQPITLQDKGAASLKPSPPAQAAEIGDVVARVLKDSGKYAKEIVDTAAGKLDPSHTVEALKRITDPLVDQQRDELTTELTGVAAAAGVSADQLKAKVDKQKAEAEAKAATAATQLDAKAGQAQEDVKKRGTDQTSAIAGASAAVKEDVERKEQAAKGEPDAAAIDAKRDGYLGKLNSTAAADLARFRASVETRAADLDRVTAEQKAAYKTQARDEAQRIIGLYPDDLTKGKIEARPVLDWADKQGLEVEGIAARLKREATAASKQLQAPLDGAVEQARDQIRDWAAEKKGSQRSWWDRLLDMFSDWTSKAKVDNKAWEARRNAETRDKVAGDFDMLVKMRDQLASGNQEVFQAEMSRLSAEQRAVVMAFIRSGGKDSIGAVAIGLIARIKAHRVPEFSKALEEQAIAELGWEELNKLGAAQTPGFDAGIIVRDVRGSVKGWGTDENRLFKALQGRTPLQVGAMRKAYAATYPGRDMDEDINEDVSGSEQERADALLSGDPTAAAVATLNDAMDGAGTNEALIMETLRGKTSAERDAITAAYKEKYGVDLKVSLADEMSDNDLDQANALLAGDTTKADAIEVNEAMEGVGTDEKAINAVYTRIRDEVEADAKRKGMTTAEVKAEVLRRTAALKSAYGAKYAGGDESKLEADFRDELSGGELTLVLAEQASDETAMDAAKIQIEHESLYTDDDKVNAVLIAQHDRAKKEITRDLEVDLQEKSAHMTPAERANARKEMEEKAKGLIAERAKQNMTALKDRYNAENPDFGFQAVIDLELQGYSHDEALERIDAGGKLDDAHELKYSIFGPGTNEDRIKETLKGKSKAEIDKIKADYKALTGNDLAADIAGDMEGRDGADADALLGGTSTPAEKMAYLKKRKEWEVNEGTGIVGEAFENEEEDVLERTAAKAQEAYAKYEDFKKKYGEKDPRTVAALEDFERWSGYGDKDIEEHRAALDSITDTIAAGVAIAVGIAATILTAGAAGPAVLAAAAAFGTSTTVVAAAAGAIAATAASMLTKQLMKGGAYDIEAITQDMAQGTLEALIAVGTAGTGEAALKALMKSPAFAALKEAAESGALGRIVIKGVEGGIEGGIQGLPGGMSGAILDENTWKSDNPFGVVISAGGKGSLQGAGMGAGMGAVMTGVHEIGGSKGGGGTKVEPEGHRSTGTEEHGSGHGDTTTPTTEKAGSVDTVVPIDADVPAGAGGDAAHAGVDEGAHTGPTEEPHGGADREAQAPKATEESKGLGDEAPVPDTERTAVDDIHDAMPEETVMQGPDPKDPSHAREMYDNSIAESPRREAAIYRNTETGEYIVIQGDEGKVSVGGGEAPHEAGKQQRWKEILNGGDQGTWELQAHSHPAGPTGVVDPINQWPSGANGDMGVMVNEAQNAGKARSSRIDYVTADGPGHTDFGFDPGHERPYWVDAPDGGGGRTVERFKTMEGYHDFIENKLGGPTQGDIPDHMSGVAPAATGAEPTTPKAAADAAPTEGEIKKRLDGIREKYGESAETPEARKALQELAKLAKKDPAAAAEALDAFEAQAGDRNVESAFAEGSKAASKEEKALGFEPGEEPPEGLTETDQKHRRLRQTGASAELEAAMAAQGDPRPPGHDTHHIVADAEARAAVARKILLESGINPRNNPENGIHLPRTTMDPATIPVAATRHPTIHSNEYYKELTLRLIEAKNNGTVPETLRQIRTEIAEGVFLDALPMAGTQGETFADWLVQNSDKFEGMTREEIAAVVDGATRKPRTNVP
ncbi:hypothetical protein GCM10009712_16720 [Pseudarthrobacter sulfonivorans]|uniref:AHH domain-containing protein n=1 Tax=Pseudarthrobacter sulfonivorans TaxID=121292 RepID=UPI00168BAAD9|nr:AHH domain-containing protein [Pseudarthrobacter sulfonivorans]